MTPTSPSSTAPSPAAPAPVAIVGVGLRTAGGVRDLDGLAGLLSGDETALNGLPADRTPRSEDRVDGEPASTTGGYLEDVDRFDAEFFGIGAREAREMDPQQRLLLEVSWEALAGAGRRREDWRGSRTGVFVGLLAADYALLHARTLGTDGISPYYATGKEPSFAAGRIGYAFDLRGPAMGITTACSSSLMAVHLACRSLRTGECDAVLAGGVNLMLAPDLSVFMARVGALSPTGTCRPFAEGADGVVRGEGCGMVVLKRLDDALRDGDHVHAVIRGSAVNHDGHSAGLTVPSATAQERLLRDALADAGLAPGDIDLAQAHATGTPLGDPIELTALSAVYGADRPADAPLLVGSHKAHLGHLDAAAGITGLLATVTALQGGRVAAQPHADVATRAFDWAGSGLRVPTASTALPADRPARAGVSAFGLSGTNVHVVLEAAPAPERRADPSAPPVILPLAARTPEGLERRAAAVRRTLAGADEGTRHAVLASSAVRVDHDRHRTAVVADDPQELLDGLDAVAAGAARGPEAAGRPPRVVLVLPASVPRAAGLAAGLRDAPAAAALARCVDAVERLTPWALDDVLGDAAPADATPLRVLLVQVALAARWAAVGIRPDAVVGEGAGRLTAAYVAGALDLDEAVRRAGAGEPAEAAPAPDASGAAGAPPYGAHPVELLDEPLATYAARRGRHVAVVLGATPPGPAADGPLLSVDALPAGVAADRALRDGVAALFAAGIDPDWSALAPDVAAHVPLPPPDWRDERYWLPGVGLADRGAAPGAAVEAADAVSEEAADAASAEAADATSEEDTAATRAADAEPALRFVDRVVRELLDVGPDRRLPADAGLFDLGVDSLTAVAIARRIAEATGTEPDATLVFTRPTVAELAAHVDELRARAPQAPAVSASAPPEPAAVPGPPASAAPSVAPATAVPAVAPGSARAARSVPAREPIAIVGLGCRFPDAPNPAAYWALLRAGRTAVGPLADERRRRDGWEGLPESVPTHGAFLPEVDGFDAAFFRIAPREARSIDPQQRLLLEVAWEALEHAGLPPDALRDTPVGVFAGLNAADYGQRLARDPGTVDLYFGTGTSFAAAAGRVSYALGLQGPSMAVDTACSSSLTAVHLACRSLRDGECDVAIAGGANVVAGPAISVAMAAGGALSADGRCRSFAADAGGYGRGEGAGVVVLKTLERARADGDRVHAVVWGSAVNQDGASGGFTVPSAAAQTRVVTDALRRAGVHPDELDAVEAHGTGTPLGDPIEVRALTDALADRTAGPLVLGSAKAAIGHLEAAAGVAGVVKLVLALGHEELPPHPAVGDPSPRIPWEGTPLRLGDAVVPWPADGTRRAGVSAFGFTGSNAHVVLGDPPDEAVVAAAAPPVGTPAGPVVLPFSAATPDALRGVAGRLADALDAPADPASAPVELGEASATLAHRRSHLARRAVVLADDRDSAVAALRAFAADGAAPGIVHGSPEDGIAPSSAEACAAWAARDAAHGRARGTALAHVAGEPCDWAAVVPAGGPPVDLPTYPWEHRSFWIAAPATDPASPAPDAPSAGSVATAVQEPAAASDSAGTRDSASPRDPAATPDTAPDLTPAVVLDPADAVTFAIAWAPVDAPRAASSAAPSVLVGDPDGAAGRMAEALDPTPLVAAAPTEPTGWGALLEDVTARVGTVGEVVLVAADLPDGTAADATLALGRAMAVTAAPVRAAGLVTRDATHPGHPDPEQAAAWEVGRVLAVELGGGWAGAIDAGLGEEPAAAAALRAGDRDDQLVVRDGRWTAARLRPAAGAPGPAALADDGWYVVHDGGDPLARRWLAARGARRFVVPGPPPAGAADPDLRWVPEAELARHAADLAAAGDLAGVLTWATAPRSTTLRDLAPGRAPAGDTAVLEALDAATRARPPRTFLAVVPGAPAWGAVGTAGAAALAGRSAAVIARRAAAGAPARLLGLLPRAGTDEIDPEHEPLLRESGVGFLDEAGTFAALDAAAFGAETAVTAGRVDLQRHVRTCQALAPRAFLRDLEATADAALPALRMALDALPPQARPDRLVEYVAAQAAAVLELDDVSERQGFFDLGMDSVMAVGLRARLEADLALALPSTVAFDHPSAHALAHHLADALASAADVATSVPPAPAGTQAVAVASPADAPDDPRGSDDAGADGEPTDDDLLRDLEAAISSATDLLGSEHH